MSAPMSAVLAPTRAPSGRIAHLLRSWRSLRWQEAAMFVMMGLLFGIVDLSYLLEIEIGDKLLPVLIRHLVVPTLVCVTVLLAWLPADRSAVDHPHRHWRLAAAVLVGSAAAIAIMYALIPLLPWPSIGELMRVKKGMPAHMPLHPMGLLGDTLAAFLQTGLLVTVIELLRRRRRSEQTVQRMLHEHSQLKRRAMAARLAALQAQVEPQLLFDALVDIEQAYGRGDSQAAQRMEQLIRHLRVALPRLRETGSSLEAEAELLESYLAVLRELRGIPLHFEAQWPDELNGADLPPMLLLPLLQRALRLAATPPSRCTLRVEPLASLDKRDNQRGLRIALGFDRPGLCGEDAELQAMNERLRVLSGGAARLRCESDPEGTCFILELS